MTGPDIGIALVRKIKYLRDHFPGSEDYPNVKLSVDTALFDTSELSDIETLLKIYFDGKYNVSYESIAGITTIFASA